MIQSGVEKSTPFFLYEGNEMKNQLSVYRTQLSVYRKSSEYIYEYELWANNGFLTSINRHAMKAFAPDLKVKVRKFMDVNVEIQEVKKPSRTRPTFLFGLALDCSYIDVAHPLSQWDKFMGPARGVICSFCKRDFTKHTGIRLRNGQAKLFSIKITGINKRRLK